MAYGGEKMGCTGLVKKTRILVDQAKDWDLNVKHITAQHTAKEKEAMTKELPFCVKENEKDS